MLSGTQPEINVIFKKSAEPLPAETQAFWGQPMTAFQNSA